MKAYERLLSYVKVFTPSSEETGTSPSTQYQFDLARLLVQELKELGVKDADVDEHCYVYGHIPATKGYESRKKLGFIVPIRIWMADDRYNQDVRDKFRSEAAEKFFQVDEIHAIFDDYIAGNSDNWRKIWTIYTFLVWYELYFEKC